MDLRPEFDRRDTKIIGLSVDPIDNHERWAADIERTQGAAPNYPMIADTDFAISKAYGMLPADASGDPTDRTPAQNATLRNVFVIQLTTPAQWQPGDSAIIAGSVSDDQAKERYPEGWEQPLPYMRVVPTPK
jgi:alkyl hydroperoxide reductase subunit AhpC